MKSSAVILMIVITFYLGLVRPSFAYQVPQFTSCVNPQGQIKVDYESGTHGIAGKTGNFEGKDTVYSLSGDALTQCFCSSDGKGIQTNWWKVSSLTEDEINLLRSQGWIFVPNGALWGLENTPYLAFNSEYICKNSESFTPTTDIPGPGGGGSVLGINTGSVLGLASTGNIKFILSILSFSLLALLLGLILKIRSKKLSN